jgi:site-specific DNA-methyltransferase (adenine-specific)
MNNIPDKSIDFIFTDLPYATTQNDWDFEIPLEKLWKQYDRIIKDNGCIALWCQIPFNIKLGASNLKNLKYEWIIEKTRATGHLNANRAPMKAHENIMIFYKKLPTYNPQMTEGHSPVHNYTHNSKGSNCYGKVKLGISGGGSTSRYPRDVLQFKWDTQTSKLHPCQKPVAACEYMIKTYTNEKDTVLDSCAGSMTTGIAAINLNRKCILIEKDKQVYEAGKKRIENHLKLIKNN